MARKGAGGVVWPAFVGVGLAVLAFPFVCLWTRFAQGKS
jgi:hypothetical protein